MTGPDTGIATGVPAAYLALRDDAVAALEAWQAPYAGQEQWRREFLELCAAHPDALWKQGPPQHLTTGAIVLNPSLDRVLLTHHRKAGMWLQFGGHFEPRDASVHAAATREAREESGLPDLVLDPRIVELHRHELVAAAFGRCAEHLDIRYAGVVPDEAGYAVSEESLDVRWWPADELPAESAHEIGPMVQAARRMLGRSSRQSPG
ncbi:NUDIX hydrolase [Pedococcus sp. NPDC057267]|uniref:NUDIX hydrolase n=1 Tax=Pedococcus sp. NPDC057267 TaxID=3346077 RepID=UPI00362CCC8A